MDDLLGQDWSAPANKTSQTNPFSKPIPSYSGLQPSPVPLAGNGPSPHPLSRPSSGFNTNTVSSKPNTPANDSFANLLGRNAGKVPGSLTLQERQKQLLEEKRKQEAEQNQRWATQFGGGDAWDNLGSGRGTPLSGRGSPAVGVGNGALGGSNGKGRVQESEADILAAFNSAAPVDKSSHFPPPTSIPPSGRATPAAAAPTPPPASSSNRQYGGSGGNALLGDDDDDDPFGLGSLPQQRNSAPSQQTAAMEDDDDILGDLAKPVTEKPPQRSTVDDAFDIAQDQRAESPATAHPLDPAVAELVDMGFPADTSRVALQETGGDIQAAVGFLLNQAHEESRQKSQVGGDSRRGVPLQNGHSDVPRASSQRRGRESDAVPAWMRQESRPNSAQRRTDNASPGAEKDVAQYASEFGTSFLKSANSLWKQGRKQVVKAVADLQADHDPSQPKWMRDASADSQTRSSSQRRQHSTEPRQHAPQPQAPSLTDEAVLLEAANERPQKPARTTRRPDFPQELPQERRTLSPTQDLSIRSQSQPQTQPRFTQHAPHVDKRPATKLSRLEVEAQSEHAYVSPARRKRPTKPEPQPKPEPEVDLFSPAPAQPAVRSTQTQSARASPAPRPAPSQPVRPQPVAPARNIPAISPSALSTSSTHRRAGTEAFKRGDYDAAHTSYTAALTPLPPTHPLVIIVLSNRALTAIKTGDPKTAISDADRAIDIIGVSKGEGEKIDLGAGEGEKDMREFYGKALMRKAEALEHMEKWSDAASAWRLAVEAGVGGAVSLRGRDRCEKAANPRPSQPAVASTAPKSVAAKPAVKPAGRSVAPSRPAISAAQSAEAVRKLREANAAAEKADDEKFALNDKVDATLAAWKGTKSDNLRALLGSLDSVLWPEAGWKKVGMSDLVIPGKVKIIYMKAIAKVHPDKISQTATTEQRMISGAVFSTLNEAWDKFKKDNNL